MTDEKRKSIPRYWWMAGGLFLLLLAYPLSLGPVTYLLHHGYIQDGLRPPIFVCYRPLQWFLENSPQPVKDNFEIYVLWWVR